MYAPILADVGSVLLLELNVSVTAVKKLATGVGLSVCIMSTVWPAVGNRDAKYSAR